MRTVTYCQRNSCIGCSARTNCLHFVKTLEHVRNRKRSRDRAILESFPHLGKMADLCADLVQILGRIPEWVMFNFVIPEINLPKLINIIEVFRAVKIMLDKWNAELKILKLESGKKL